MVRILICDDDKTFLSQFELKIKNIISKSRFNDFEYDIISFNNPETALRRINENPPDIIFLDIDMPEINGFNIAKNISENSKDTIIIFVTSYDNYVFSSFKYQPYRFLRKSHIYNELPEAVLSALNTLLCKSKYIELGSKYFNERILISDIIYFESKGNYAQITVQSGEKYMYRSTISNLENQLKIYDFIRIHAGYLVNMKHIDKIHKNIVYLSDGEQIGISRKFCNDVKYDFAEYLRR